jgi:membrane protein
MVENARQPSEGVLATLTGLIVLLFGASGAFNELRQAMNAVWEVPRREGGGIRAVIRDRILSFAMVLFIGFLLLVSLVLSAALSAMGEVTGGFMTEKLRLLQVVNAVVSLGVVTVLFAMIFKFLPDAQPAIAWKDVWIGAFMTSILFTVGKLAIGLYLGRGTVGSAYGAAGSLIVILVWVYYAAQILFFGAELTQVYASRHGSRAGAAAKARDGPAGRTAGRLMREPVAVREREEAASKRSVGLGAAVAAGLLLLGRVKRRRD